MNIKSSIIVQTLIIAIALSVTNLSSSAQVVVKSLGQYAEEALDLEDRFSRNLSIKEIEGKVYINCKTLSDLDQGLLVLERSSDGDNFEILGYKECFSSPFELRYDWIDNTPVDGTAYYRVTYVNTKGDPMRTTALSVNVSDQSILSKRGL